MEIRAITPDELAAARELCFVAFGFAIDGAANPAQSAEQIKTVPQTRMKLQYRNTLAAFEDNGSMVATLSHCTATAQFDGTTVQLNEVGDVAALPCCKGRSVMKNIFTTMLDNCYSRGVEFSYLYPFSGCYYRQFGYSYCARMTSWSIALGQLPSFKTTGTMQLYKPDRLGDMQSIYNSFVRGRNLSLVREEIEWHSVTGRFDPAVDRMFTYIYYSHTGIPMGYLTYSVQETAQGSCMRCTQFAYSCREGLLGLLDFARSQQAYHSCLIVTLPDDIRLELVLPEFNMSPHPKDPTSMDMRGMVRIVHLQNSLKKAAYSGSGSLTLEVSDPYLPQNSGCWELSWQDGRLSLLRQVDSGADVDLHIGIDLLSTLLCRGITRGDLALLDDGVVEGNADAVLACFPPKQVGIFEYF